jgi:hypothetical protein
MSQGDYRHLIDRICEIKQLRDVQAKYERCSLIVDEVLFTLVPSAGAQGIDSVAYFCDFGPLPHESRALALEHLLETNLYMFGSESPSFACNPETKHVLLLGRVALDRLSAESAIQLLGGLADYAHEWRASRFLSPDAQAADRAPRRSAGDVLQSRGQSS